MNEAVKLTALKKAYADIILNTAKEAAAKIMATDRKAMRLQQELFAAKEEALHMLLRIKQMMDAKIIEAEMTSLSQQQKIEELEAQLNEAEDIVRDLRAELREVQDELEKVRANQSPLEEPHLKGYTATQEEEFQENRLHTPDSIICPPMDFQPEPVITFDVKDSTLNQRNECNKCQSANESHSENQYDGNPDFASIMMMNKEPELSRNGCTQRIRAFERNSLDVKLSVSGELDGAKNEWIVREDEKGEGTDIRPVWKTDKLCSLLKEPDELKEVKHADKKSYQLQDRIPNKLKRHKPKKEMHRHLRDQDMEMCQASDLSSSKTSSPPVNNNVQSGENPSKINDNEYPKEPESHWASRDSSYTTQMSSRSGCVNGNLSLSGEVDGVKNEAVVREDEKGSHIEPVLGVDICCSLEKETDELKQVNQADKVKKLDFMEMCQASDISPSITFSYPVNNNAHSGENPPTIYDDEAPKDPESHLASSYPSYTAEMDSKSGCVEEVNGSKVEFVKSCSTRQIANNSNTLIDEVELNRQENGSAETSVVRKMDVETVNTLLKSDLKKFDATANVVPGVPANDRLIKYTFQRKRKKESLSSIDQSSVLEESILKRKKEENHHGSLDSQKSSSINESSRDSRRLAQVARQLISLSEKKWWQ